MTIEIRYKWNKEAFIEANIENMKHRFNGAIARVLNVITFGFTGIIFYLIYKHGFKIEYTFIVVVAVYLFILKWPINRLLLAWQFSKHTEKNSELLWFVDKNGMKGTGSNSHGEFTWKSITGVYKSKKGYIVERYPMFHWFPLTAFKTENDIASFESLILENGVKIKNVT